MDGVKKKKKKKDAVDTLAENMMLPLPFLESRVLRTLGQHYTGSVKTRFSSAVSLCVSTWPLCETPERLCGLQNVAGAFDIVWVKEWVKFHIEWTIP